MILFEIFLSLRGDAVFRHGAVLGLSELIPKLNSTDDGSFAKELRNIPVRLSALVFTKVYCFQPKDKILT